VPPHGAWHKVWTALGKARRAQKRARMRTWYDPWGAPILFSRCDRDFSECGAGGPPCLFEMGQTGDFERTPEERRGRKGTK
jgi:hypothetical protein